MPAIPQTWLDEFQVNETDLGIQDEPDVIQLANGNILVSWTSYQNSGVGSDPAADIIGRIFDPTGNPVTDEFQLNTSFFSDSETTSSIAALPSGGFVMVYEDTDTNSTSIRLQEYDATGDSVSSSNVVSDSPNDNVDHGEPQIAVSGATSALVVYRETVGAEDNVVAKLYNPLTNSFGSAISVFGAGGDDVAPVVTALSNGNYVIAAARDNAGDQAIVYRILSSTGANVRGATAIEATADDGHNDSEPSVAALANGGFVIAYTDRDGTDTDVAYSVFNAAGDQIASGLAGLNSNGGNDNTNEAVVAGLADGSFVIALDNDVANTLEVSHVSADGTYLGSMTLGNVGTEPAIADLGDGRFTVTWSSTSGSDISMEILDTRDFVNADAVYTPLEWQVGTNGDDVFTADVSAEVVHGWEGDDTITENGNIKSYYGDAGKDVFRVVSLINTDSHDGGDGIDTINWSASAQVDGLYDLELEMAIDGGNIEAMSGFENFVGTGNRDYIRGTATANVLIGGGGDDNISGRGGIDTMRGGAGNDSYVVSEAGDIVDESVPGSNGTDAVFSAVSYSLATAQVLGAVEELHLVGTSNVNAIGNGLNNVISGNSAHNVLNGGGGADHLRGLGGNDVYVIDNAGDVVNEIAAGSSGNDLVQSSIGFSLNDGAHVLGAVENLMLTGAAAIAGIGNAGNNLLIGNSASNLLIGGGGNDSFRFITALNSASNVDFISDFNVAQDTIQLENAVFAGLAAGALDAGAFRIGAAAGDANDRIIYNAANGALFFDADGAGGAAQIRFATLDAGLALTSADFFVL